MRSLTLKEFASRLSGLETEPWLGASLKVIAPTGQYSGKKLVNWGINRWGFKPELGYSRLFGKWMLDAYGGAWFFTTNNAFPPIPAPQTEGPIGSFEVI